MLRWRLSLGAALIAAIIGLCWLDAHAETPAVWLLPLALVISVLASGEVVGLLSAQDLKPQPWIVYAGNLAIVASNVIPRFWPNLWPENPLGTLGWPLLTLGLFILLAFLGEMQRYQRPGGVIVNLALSLFGLLYVGLLLSFVVQLRLLGHGMTGVAALGSLIIVVKMGDTGAYTLGRLFGKHKMAPVLSPKKTYEGAAGAVLFAVLGAWVALDWLLPMMAGDPARGAKWWGWLSYGVVVGLTGMFGDLAESLFKRDMGRKDSSTWMPGFGGVLDVLDSILFAAPVAYLWWVSGLIVGPL